MNASLELLHELGPSVDRRITSRRSPTFVLVGRESTATSSS